MKAVVLIIYLISLFYNPVESSKKELLCKTWISFQEIDRIPIRHTYRAHFIRKDQSDSLIINKNLEFYRYSHGVSFNGVLQFGQDSTFLTYNPLLPFVGNSSPDISEVNIEELTETSFTVSYIDGREGESIVIKYRPGIRKL